MDAIRSLARRFRSDTVALSLLLAVFGVVGSTLVGGLHQTHQRQQQLLDLATARGTALTARLGADLEATVRHAGRLTESGLSTHSIEFERLGRLLEERPLLLGASVTDAEGEVQIGRRRADPIQYGAAGAKPLSVRDRAYFAAVRERPLPLASEMLTIRPAQVQGLTLVAPWFDRGRFGGVVVASVAAEALLEPGQDLLPRGVSLLLLDRERRILAGAVPGRERAEFERALRGIDLAQAKDDGGVGAWSEQSGSRWLFAHAGVVGRPDLAVLALQSSNGNGGGLPILSSHLALAFSLVIAFMLGVGWLAERAAAPIAMQSRLLAAGDVSAAVALADTLPQRDLCHEAVVISRGLAAFEERWRQQSERAKVSEDYLRTMNELLGEEVRNREALIEQRTHDLRSALEEARAASESKTRLLANTSHELRTPLNGIVGQTELLLTQDLPEPVQRACETIQTCAEGMQRVIEDLLAVAALRNAGFVLRVEPFDLATELDLVAAHAREGAAERGLAFTETIDPRLRSWRQGDPLRIRQVLLNLVSNAIKFTDRGHIALDAQLEPDGTVRFAISDTGVGIPPDQLDRIFEPFHQVDGSFSRQAGGTGLGLTIARELATRMGGAVSVDSTGTSGSTFSFRIRLPEVDQRAPTPAPTLPEIPQVRALRALVVDDAPINGMVLASQLSALGLDAPEVVADGFAALARLGRGDIDIMFLDCQMPGMDGYEVARRVRSRPEFMPLRIVGVTAHAHASDRQRCLDAGMDDYLPKPVRLSALRAALNRVSSETSEFDDPLTAA